MSAAKRHNSPVRPLPLVKPYAPFSAAMEAKTAASFLVWGEDMLSLNKRGACRRVLVRFTVD